jgi:hypothetical protein
LATLALALATLLSRAMPARAQGEEALDIEEAVWSDDYGQAEEGGYAEEPAYDGAVSEDGEPQVEIGFVPPPPPEEGGADVDTALLPMEQTLPARDPEPGLKERVDEAEAWRAQYDAERTKERDYSLPDPPRGVGAPPRPDEGADVELYAQELQAELTAAGAEAAP